VPERNPSTTGKSSSIDLDTLQDFVVVLVSLVVSQAHNRSTGSIMHIKSMKAKQMHLATVKRI